MTTNNYSDTIELARLLGSLYTEVFQRSESNDNKPISQSTHNQDRMTIDEDVFAILVTATNETLWGPSGISHHLNFSGIQGVWGEGGTWGQVFALLENGDFILLENGDKIIL